MEELIRRMRRTPASLARLMLAGAFVNILGLLSSLYVMQVISRYVSHGITGTLFTLTAGALIALAGEHVFRVLRLDIAEEIVGREDETLATGIFGLLATARRGPDPQGLGEALLRGLERAEAALGPAAVVTLADIPFCLLFLLALLLLAPVLAGVVALCALLLCLIGHRQNLALTRPLQDMAAASLAVPPLLRDAVAANDTVRQFRAAGALTARWSAATARLRALRGALARRQARSASLLQALQAGMSIAVVGVGAALVVDGRLDLGSLIGANIIAGRAVAPLVRLVQSLEGLRKASEALGAARRFAAAVPVEPARGAAPRQYRGGLELRSVTHAFPGMTLPLFRDLSFAVPPGGVAAITGPSGSGKSTLGRLLVGLIQPLAGLVLADGIDLRQLDLDWWRGQVGYLPQTPHFLSASLRDNLLAAHPAADGERLWACLAAAGVARFVQEAPGGLDMMISDGGQALSPGIRRGLALARALLVDGPLLVLDEPTEGLDPAGVAAVYGVLIDLARRGKTLVVITHDPHILQGAASVFRLGEERVVVP